MPLRFRSASSPCPTDSWISVPPASLESTTVYVPAGAGSAATFWTARRAAVRVVSSTASSVSISKPSVPALALYADSRTSPCLAVTCTPKTSRVRVSFLKRPSLFATTTSCTLSRYRTVT